MDIVVTGVSSGIGRELTKELIAQGHRVIGIARRQKLLYSLQAELKNNKRFIPLRKDLSTAQSWEQLIKELGKRKFRPEVVVLNAAILENDLHPSLDSKITERIFAINFWSNLWAVEKLLPYLKPKAQFIAISSVAALRGSSVEGLGYSSSKAALSIIFEGLHQRYKSEYYFTTIYLGPVKTGMSPFTHKDPPLALSSRQVVDGIIKAIREKRPRYYYPLVLFIGFRLIRILPLDLDLKLLSVVESMHKKLTGLH